MDIMEAAKENPESAFSTSIEIREDAEEITLEIDSSLLPFGFFELRRIMLHTSTPSNDLPNRMYIGGEHFERVFFQVCTIFDPPSPAEAIAEHCLAAEEALEQQFLSGIELPKIEAHHEYTCFVFIDGVLIGRRMRFDRFEIVPYERGLDGKDKYDLINEFFSQKTKTKLQFSYQGDAAAKSRQEHPVSIVHFPLVISDQDEKVVDYCLEQAEILLQALAVTRDSKGKVFDIVVVNHHKKESHIFSIREPYLGNLLTGSFAGEHSSTILDITNKLRQSPFLRFAYSLYGETLLEKSSDFKILRFWQILELLSDSKNFPDDTPLVRADGTQICDAAGHAIRSKSSPGKVYLLLGLMNSTSNPNWEDINIWFALRTSVAHHGSTKNYQQLSRPDVVKWAALGIQKNHTAGHNVVLMELQRTVNDVLKRTDLFNPLTL